MPVFGRWGASSPIAQTRGLQAWAYSRLRAPHVQTLLATCLVSTRKKRSALAIRAARSTMGANVVVHQIIRVFGNQLSVPLIRGLDEDQQGFRSDPVRHNLQLAKPGFLTGRHVEMGRNDIV